MWINTKITYGPSKTSNVLLNNSAINTPVILLNSTGLPVAWTQTDSVGNYTFVNIALDTYKIVAQIASAVGETVVNLTPGNSVANADLLLKSLQSDTGILNPDNTVLEIYPNPTEGSLMITMKESCKVDLYNSMGQLLMHQNLNTGKNVLDISSVNKGVYLAKIGETTFKVLKK